MALDKLPKGFHKRTLTTAMLAVRLGRKMARRQWLGTKPTGPWRELYRAAIDSPTAPT